MHPQLPLPFKLQDVFNFENFIASDNEIVVQALKNPNEPFIYLWGEAGTGKTHLLQSACQHQTEQAGTACYLAAKEIATNPPSILEGLANLNLVCLDDIDTFFGQATWEEALFNLFNQIKQANGRLVVSASFSPQQANIILNDLKSRLNSGLPLNLTTLNDEDTIKVLQTRAQQLGLELNHETARYLMTRFPRDINTLRGLLEQLDQASLAAQRKLTIPFLKTTLLNPLQL